jgi:hypothetical protein
VIGVVLQILGRARYAFAGDLKHGQKCFFSILPAAAKTSECGIRGNPWQMTAGVSKVLDADVARLGRPAWAEFWLIKRHRDDALATNSGLSSPAGREGALLSAVAISLRH